MPFLVCPTMYEVNVDEITLSFATYGANHTAGKVEFMERCPRNMLTTQAFTQLLRVYLKFGHTGPPVKKTTILFLL